jgi:hypothetical protein
MKAAGPAGQEQTAGMDPTVVELTERPAPPSVRDQLLDSATDFAHSAVAAYRGEDWPVYYLHLATALEQLVKGALAHANPAYIADARDFDALLHLTGRGERASAPEFIKAAKTIPVTEALKRVGRLIDRYQPPKTPASCCRPRWLSIWAWTISSRSTSISGRSPVLPTRATSS